MRDDDRFAASVSATSLLLNQLQVETANKCRCSNNLAFSRPDRYLLSAVKSRGFLPRLLPQFVETSIVK